MSGDRAAAIEFAVVIPTRRRPDLLAQAVDSVLAQRLPAREIVVVRDGPDAVVPTWLSGTGVRVIEQPRGGVAAARNAGIAATRAPWVCFLDDDDLWHPDRLLAMAEFLAAHPTCVAAQATAWTFAAVPTPGAELAATNLAECLAAAAAAPEGHTGEHDISVDSFDLLLARSRGCISTATVRRDVLVGAGGFPPGYTCAEDWVMFLNVARYADWCFCDRRLSFVRKHAGNNTTTNPTNDLVTVRALRAVWDDRTRPTPQHRPLVAYALDYRLFLEQSLWRALGRRCWGIAGRLLVEGWWMTPRWRDRAVVLLPPALAVRLGRWRRLLVGTTAR